MDKAKIATEKIRGLILDGEFPVGSRLMPERELARMFGFSQNTVTKAIAILAGEGLVRKIHGSGNYVTLSRPPQKGFDICFLAEMREGEVNPVWHLIFESLYEASDGSGLNVALKLLPKNGLKDVADDLSPNGLIVAATSLHPERAQALIGTGKPILWLEEYSKPLPGPSVCVDNFEAGRLAGRHLMEQGCSSLLYIAYHFVHGSHPSDRRFDGFLSGARESGQTPATSIWPCYTTPMAAETPLKERLKGVDGVFCFCDVLASQVMKIAGSSGRRAPADFAIAGVDGLPFGELLPIGMTTVKQPCQKIGRLAFDTALRMLKGERIEGVFRVKPELIVRESSLRSSCAPKAG